MRNTAVKKIIPLLDIIFNGCTWYRHLKKGTWYLVAPWPAMPYIEPFWCTDGPNGMEKLLARENFTSRTPDKFMVFDVESIGLHGEGFAVAWVVVNRDGERMDEGCLACDPNQCKGTDDSRLWVSENVPQMAQTSPTKMHLYNTFWHEWRRWADQGAVLVADCAWPVEANFLSACVKLNHAERKEQGPYPLHDLASVLLALGADALAVTERLPDELPAHHPLMDARQSARQLVELLKRGKL